MFVPVRTLLTAGALVFAAAALPASMSPARAQLEIDVNKGTIEPLPIAVTDFLSGNALGAVRVAHEFGDPHGVAGQMLAGEDAHAAGLLGERPAEDVELRLARAAVRQIDRAAEMHRAQRLETAALEEGRTVGRTVGGEGRALDAFAIDGIRHNIPFVSALMHHPRWIAGNLSTGFIAEEFPEGFSLPVPQGEVALRLAAIAIACDHKLNQRKRAVSAQMEGWRRVAFDRTRVVLVGAERFEDTARALDELLRELGSGERP